MPIIDPILGGVYFTADELVAQVIPQVVDGADLIDDPAEAEADTIDEEIDEYLDRVDLERQEWERLHEDLFPGVDPETTNTPQVHRSDDEIQRWMADQRQS